ncbi:hypothetical protein [Amycolatopsis sp. Hca4]|uniref:hypothetical protein n=1 Tax=Amycolatopsis sp. Hca4 TaxID=2742131 RepID=UPI001C37C709|nr:hypothetical protein [Amycolatopsis sp. Hca4]
MQAVTTPGKALRRTPLSRRRPAVRSQAAANDYVVDLTNRTPSSPGTERPTSPLRHSRIDPPIPAAELNSSLTRRASTEQY